MTLRIGIAGGGIGGMALALSLHDAGFSDVDVYESAGTVKELGVGINRQGGPERCIDIVEARAPDGFVELDDVISLEELEEISRRYKRTAGFDPEILNTRPSLTVRQHRLSRRGRRATWRSPSWT